MNTVMNYAQWNILISALFIYVLFAGETKFSAVQGVHPLTQPTEATIVEHVLVLSLYYWCLLIIIIFSSSFHAFHPLLPLGMGVTGEEVTLITVLI